MAKKREDVWEVKRPYMHLHAYLTLEEFIATFERGLRGHFAKSALFGKENETFHIEDLSYSAEFYAENFAMIMSAIDWKEYKNGR